METTNEVTRSPNGVYEKDCSLQIREFVDLSSFITADVFEQLQLIIQPMSSKSRLANREHFSVVGVLRALVSMNNFDYTISLSIVSHLICSAIISLNVLSQNETLLLTFGGRKIQLDVSILAAIAGSNEFRPMVIDSPKIHSDENHKPKPIATKSRNSIN